MFVFVLILILIDHENDLPEVIKGHKFEYRNNEEDYFNQLLHGKYPFIKEAEEKQQQQLLLQEGKGETNEKDNDQVEELSMAFIIIRTKFAIEKGPKVDDVSLLHFAAMIGHVKYLEGVYNCLLLFGNDPKVRETIFNEKASQNRSLSEFACRGGHISVLKFLHEKGLLDVTSPNDLLKPPIYITGQNGATAEPLSFTSIEI